MSGNARTAQPAFVGIGSNLDDPIEQIEQAMALLERLPDTRIVARSSLYQSAPFGAVEQPDFINAVAHLSTGLDVWALFRQMQDIENIRGRVRGVHWGPRNIDLDLLAFGDTIVDTTDLTVPHPGIVERNFVLLPLQEIVPDFEIPGLGRVADIAVDDNEPRIFRIE